MGFNPFRVATAIGTLGLSELAGDDFMARIPIVGGLGGYKTDSEKNLEKTQQRLAEEAKQRAAQNERTRMQALGQQMLAFNPRNQVMAQMFGPEAAFTPHQFAQMVANPNQPQQPPPGQGSENQRQALAAQQQEELRRQKLVEAGMSPLPNAPQPIFQPKAQPGRMY